MDLSEGENMAINLEDAQILLKEHHLLKGQFTGQKSNFEHVTYDSRQVEQDTLFFCKGNFKREYLVDAIDHGATGYVAEEKYVDDGQTSFLIVTDVQKAMALLGAAFYGYPQNDLFVIGITGTKGKTTSSYFAKGILDQTLLRKRHCFQP